MDLSSRQYLQGNDCSDEVKLQRPPVSDLDGDIEFMQFDCDSYQDKSGANVIRLFGVNAIGNSLCVYVHNFLTYFYVRVLDDAAGIDAKEIEQIRNHLNMSVDSSGMDGVPLIEVVRKHVYKPR